METKILPCSQREKTHTVGVSILTDRQVVASEMGKRILQLPNLNLTIATSSADELVEEVQHGDTCVVLVSYRCLEDFSHIENDVNKFNPSMRKYVMAWVSTYEITQWAEQHGFLGVITHFDFSCRTPSSLINILDPASHQSAPDHLQPMLTPLGPISYKDQTDEEIAAMIASGMSDQEIANTLYLSLQTIRNRVSRMLHDSGIRNRTHLAMVYLTSLETFID